MSSPEATSAVEAVGPEPSGDTVRDTLLRSVTEHMASAALEEDPESFLEDETEGEPAPEGDETDPEGETEPTDDDEEETESEDEDTEGDEDEDENAPPEESESQRKRRKAKERIEAKARSEVEAEYTAQLDEAKTALQTEQENFRASLEEAHNDLQEADRDFDEARSLVEDFQEENTFLWQRIEYAQSQLQQAQIHVDLVDERDLRILSAEREKRKLLRSNTTQTESTKAVQERTKKAENAAIIAHLKTTAKVNKVDPDLLMLRVRENRVLAARGKAQPKTFEELARELRGAGPVPKLPRRKASGKTSTTKVPRPLKPGNRKAAASPLNKPVMTKEDLLAATRRRLAAEE